MQYEIIFAPEAIEDVQSLKAYVRSQVRDAIERYLRHAPTSASASRIKRLHGVSRPQFRLRVGDLRVFYDVQAATVEVLAVVSKSKAAAWLKEVEGSR